MSTTQIQSFAPSALADKICEIFWSLTDTGLRAANLSYFLKVEEFIGKMLALLAALEEIGSFAVRLIAAALYDDLERLDSRFQELTRA